MKNKNKILTTKAELMTVLNKKFTPEYLQNRTILTLGAGDIDTFVEPIKMLLNK
jgi:hypothetical protein